MTQGIFILRYILVDRLWCYFTDVKVYKITRKTSLRHVGVVSSMTFMILKL